MNRTNIVCTVLLAFTLALPSYGQLKTYNWVQGNDETVRLDPGYYHTSPPYQPGSGAKSMHVDIDAQQPVTLAVVTALTWNDAAGRLEDLSRLNLVCVQEHVMQTSYTCNVPLGVPTLLLVRDERGERTFAGRGEVTRGRDYDKQQASPQGMNNGRPGDSDADRNRERRDPDRIIAAGVDAFMGSRARRLFSYPNDVHIQYYDWTCTASCDLPDPPRPKLYDWVPAATQLDRLDPGEFFHGNTFEFGTRDVEFHFDVQSRWPVTVAVVSARDWYDAIAQRSGKTLNNINYVCLH